jgi:hypothetical protein
MRFRIAGELVNSYTGTAERQQHLKSSFKGEKQLLYGDGCKFFATCESCPFPDCRWNSSWADLRREA